MEDADVMNKIKKMKQTYKVSRRKVNKTEWRNHKHAKKYKEEVLDKVFIDKENTVELIAKGYLRFEEERLLITAQDCGLGTNWFKTHIEKQNFSDRCRMCGAEGESVLHILSGCETLIHRHIYAERHNIICKLIHCRLCRKYNIEIVPHHQ